MNFVFDEENHHFQVDGRRWPSVTQVLADEGFIDTRWYTSFSRDRGTLVHRIIHWHIEDNLDEQTIDPTLRPYFDAWLRFEAQTGFRSIETETPRISELYSFGGIPDSIGLLNGQEVILETKTGALSRWVGLQLAAQEILCDRALPRYAIRLSDTGKYDLKHYKDPSDRSVFLSALCCWWWKNKARR